MTRELTCIICPRGCSLTVTLDEGKVAWVVGNACPRGVKYANDECTNPKRTVTTTVRCADGAVVPVKTNKSIPKDKVFLCMAEINRIIAPRDVKIGDVVIASVAGTDADVIVTGKKPE
jgi:CxxC motif-containing protein